MALVVIMTAGVPERAKQGPREAGNAETEPEQAIPCISIIRNDIFFDTVAASHQPGSLVKFSGNSLTLLYLDSPATLPSHLLVFHLLERSFPSAIFGPVFAASPCLS